MDDAAATPFVSGVILAAGASTRMGRPKQLLDLGGRTVLQRVVDEAVASRLDEVVVVLGHRAGEIAPTLAYTGDRRMRVVVNDAHGRGQAGSLLVGLRATDPRATAAAVLLGDQPGVDHALIADVLERHRACGRPVLRPFFGDGRRRVPGHPVLLGREVWAEIAAARGDEGARTILEANPQWVTEVLVDRPPPPDIDTWDDYARELR